MVKIASFFIFFTYIIFIFGCEPKYEFASKDVNLTLKSDLEKDLSRRHLDYWEAFSKKQFDDTFKFELAYQQFIKGKAWYKEFFAGNNSNYKIILKNIEIKDNDTAVVATKYIRKKSSHIFYDKWYYVNGTWYHWFKTSKLPKPDDK